MFENIEYVNYIEEYWNKINSGEIIVGKYIYKTYEYLYNKLTDTSDGFYFDIKKASLPIVFVETFCRNSKGKFARKPVKLLLFQKALIQAMFGFIDKDGYRQFNEVMFVVGRKNGKSTLASALEIYAAIEESGAEVYSVATKKEQASLSYNECVNMVAQSPDLQAFFKKKRSCLESKYNFSKIAALASDSSTLDGKNASFCLIDELHAIKDQDLISVMKQSTSMRNQAIIFYATTNGFERDKIFDILLDYAKRIVDKKVKNDRFLPMLYLQDSTDEIFEDRSTWIKSNPSLGVIKSEAYIEQMFEKARAVISERRTLLTKDFNISENSSEAFLDWNVLNNEETFDLEIIADHYCVGGLDLAQTNDLACAGLLAKRDGKYYYHCMCFLPRDVIDKKTQETGIPYSTWRDIGLLRESGTDRVDYADIVNWYDEMREEYQMTFLKIAYDPYNTVYLKKEMIEHGYEEALWKCRQGYQTLSAPLKQMSVDLAAKNINYNNNSIVKWCLSNVAVKRDINNNIMPDKKNSNTLKIDAAAVMLFCFCALAHCADDIGNLMD